MFLEAREEWKENIALLDIDGNTMTYGNLAAQTESLRSLLKSRTVVLMLCEYSMETVAMYYSMLQLRIVPLLIDAKADEEYIRRLCETYHPHYIWGKTSKKELFAGIYPGEVVIERGEHILYETDWEVYELYPELALLLTTSGSTGSPKMVRLSYRNLEHNAETAVRELRINTRDRGITNNPMHHCFGLTIIHTCWAAGAGLCLFDGSVLNPNYLKMIAAFRVSIIFIVPYAIELINISNGKEKDISSLKHIIVAGAKMSSIQKDILSEICKINNFIPTFAYGQTEGTGFISLIRGRTDSVGKVIDGMKVYLENISEDSIGEVVIEGASVSLGYAQAYIDLSKGDEHKGILHTGDLGTMDEDGNLFLKGRIKRIAKILGERINLDEIEHLLLERFSQGNFACIGETDSVIVFATGDVDEGEIKDFLFKNIGIYKNMINVKQTDTMPRTESGKVAYADLEGLV